jgi:SSS family solute:Na+ symporter
MGIHVAIVIGLLLYVGLTTAVSFLMMARVRKPDDYLVAGRGLPFCVLTGTIVGTCIGTGVIIGGSGLAYRHGWAGSAYPIGLGLGTSLAGLFFARMRRFKFMTLTEEVACYYDGNPKVIGFSHLTIFFSQLCWLTVQIMGGAAVLGAVTGLDPKLCVILAGFAKAAISIPGGLKAVVYTDVLQTLILFFGFGFLVRSALVKAGGLSGLEQSVPAVYFSFLGTESLGGWKVFSLILVLCGSVLADPGRRLTMYSARTEAGAKWSMVVSGLIVILFSASIGIIGMYTFRLNPNLRTPDQALPWLVMNMLPPWLAALVVVAVVSGMSSAANGTAAAAGTFFIRHIFPLLTGHFPERPVLVVRWALAGVFVFSTALGLFTGSVVGFVIKFLPLTMSGLAVTILLGRFWNRATWQGALAGLITTPLVSIVAMGYLDNPTLPAMLAGAAALVLVSLGTPPRRRSIEEVAEAMARERASIEGALSHAEFGALSQSAGSASALYQSQSKTA